MKEITFDTHLFLVFGIVFGHIFDSFFSAVGAGGAVNN